MSGGGGVAVDGRNQLNVFNQGTAPATLQQENARVYTSEWVSEFGE